MGVVKQALHKSRIAAQFSRHAQGYIQQAKIQHHIATEALAQASELFVSRGDCIVDLGCGVGHNLDALSHFAEDVIGVDIASGMIANNVSTFPIIESDFDQLALPDASADFVFSSMALQWSDAPERVLSQIHRVLKPGGRALCAIMVSPSFVRLQEAFLQAGLTGRINEFAPSSAWQSDLFAKCQFNEQVFVDEFDDFRTMMGSIKEVGASTVLCQSGLSRISRTQYAQVIDALGGEYRLDYRVCFLSLIK